MDSEQILDGLRDDKIIYTGIGLLVIAGLVIAMDVGMQSMNGGEQVQATLNIDFGDSWESNSIHVENNTSILGALNASYPVEYTEYDMGAFVTSIDGIAQDDEHSWLYFVNGESASVAVDRNFIDDGDNITFRYLHNNETSQYIE